MTGRALVLSLLVAACATPDPFFDEVGFVHPDYGYHIGYANPRTGTWLSGDWRVENYGRERGEWVRRVAPQYWHTPTLDLDSDGIATSRGREYIYDLRLRHVRTNGMIWVRTVPLELDLQTVELDVLARNYVENIAGLGFLLARVAPGAVEIEERRYASRLLDQMPMQIDGYEAYGVLLEVASVEQLQLSDASRVQNAVIVLSRAPFGWRERSAEGYRDWPVIVVIGYSNSPAEFEAGLPDFARLLAAMDLDGERERQ